MILNYIIFLKTIEKRPVMKIEIASASYQKLTSRWNTNRFTPDERLIPWARLYLPCKGEGMVRTADGEYPLTPGKMLLIPAYGIVHLSCPEYLEKYWSHFNLYQDESGSDFFPFFHEPLSYTLQEGEFEYFCRLFQRLCDSFNKAAPLSAADEMIQHSALSLLLEPFLKNSGNAAYRERPPQLIRIVTVMKQRDFRDLSMEELSGLTKMPAHYIFKLFREQMNCSPFFYMKQQRLLKACLQLTHALDMTVSEIAGECGYETVAAFSKAFHQQYGVSPREYRKTINKDSGRAKEESF